MKIEVSMIFERAESKRTWVYEKTANIGDFSPWVDQVLLLQIQLLSNFRVDYL